MMGMGGGYPSDTSPAPAENSSNYAAAAAALGMPDPSTMAGGGMMGGDLHQQLMALQPQGMGVGALNDSYGSSEAQLRQQIALAAESGFERTTGDWPLATERVGPKIRALEATPGNVRHDILVEKQRVGRLIGPQGSTLKALLANTGCEIFVMDKEGPPEGFGMDQRVVVLVGSPGSVTLANHQILDTLQGPGGPVGGIGVKRGADEDSYGNKRARM